MNAPSLIAHAQPDILAQLGQGRLRCTRVGLALSVRQEIKFSYALARSARQFTSNPGVRRAYAWDMAGGWKGEPFRPSDRPYPDGAILETSEKRNREQARVMALSGWGGCEFSLPRDSGRKRQEIRVLFKVL